MEDVRPFAVIILFDGGMRISWNRFRTLTGAVVWLVVAGTAITATALAPLAHLVVGFDWLVWLDQPQRQTAPPP